MNWYNIKKAKSENMSIKIKDLSLSILDTVDDHTNDLRKLIDESDNFEPWMIDKLATARNDLNDIRMHLEQCHLPQGKP